jgi:AcrR family transcriptional regulator
LNQCTIAEGETKSRKQKAIEAEILRIAADVFSEKGYRATTLDDIVAAAGFSRATFYSYFPSKEELLCRMYQQVTSSTQAAIERIAAEDLPTPGKLRRIMRYQISYLAEHTPLVRVFFSEVLNLPPKMVRSVIQANRAYSRVIERVVEEGVRAGALAPMNPKRLTYALIGMCNWTHRWYRRGGEWTPDAVADEFIRLVESGYLRRDGESANNVLLREVQALQQKVETITTTLRRSARPAPRRQHQDRTRRKPKKP